MMLQYADNLTEWSEIQTFVRNQERHTGSLWIFGSFSFHSAKFCTWLCVTSPLNVSNTLHGCILCCIMYQPYASQLRVVLFKCPYYNHFTHKMYYYYVLFVWIIWKMYWAQIYILLWHFYSKTCEMYLSIDRLYSRLYVHTYISKQIML